MKKCICCVSGKGWSPTSGLLQDPSNHPQLLWMLATDTSQLSPCLGSVLLFPMNPAACLLWGQLESLPHSHLPWQSPLHKGSTVPTSPLSNLFPFTLRGLCHEIPAYEYCLATLHIMDAYQTRKIADYIIHHQHWAVVGQSWRLKLSKSQFVHLANWNNNFHVAVYLKEKYKVII